MGVWSVRGGQSGHPSAAEAAGPVPKRDKAVQAPCALALIAASTLISTFPMS